MTTRHSLGLDTDVFAGSADPAQRIKFGEGDGETYVQGWPSEYSTPGSGKYPSRKNFNYLFASFTAGLSDINRFGSSLPWNINIPYEERATVTSDGGVLFKAISANTGVNPDTDTNGIWTEILSTAYVDDLNASPVAGVMYVLKQTDVPNFAPKGMYLGEVGGYRCVFQQEDFALTWNGAQSDTYLAGVRYSVSVTGNISVDISLGSVGESVFYLSNGGGHTVAPPTTGKKRTSNGLVNIDEATVELVLTSTTAVGLVWSAIALLEV